MSTHPLKPGDKAPDFRLPALPEGMPVSLTDFRGKYVVLYFYPRDMTPGCTTEACEFRDAQADLARENAVVLGISGDSIESHRKFAMKYELSFPLLADEDHAVAEKYGVWVEKTMYGKKSWGMQRATFLIDPGGTIVEAWPKVRVQGHVAAVIAKLSEPSQ